VYIVIEGIFFYLCNVFTVCYYIQKSPNESCVGIATGSAENALKNEVRMHRISISNVYAIILAFTAD
jgi:hypothetical protein